MKFVTVVVMILIVTNSLDGCTEFFVKSTDIEKSIIIARTMEFGIASPYNIITDPKGTKYQATEFPPDSTCSNSDRMSWTAKSAQIYIAPNHPDLPKDLIIDAQTDAGLSVGNLYFPGYAFYPKPNEIPKEKCGYAISHLDVQRYLQSNFNTVAELRTTIENDKFPFVYGKSLKVPSKENPDTLVDFVFPFHWSVYDKSGDSLVLEYSKDGRKIYFNSIGVFTNSPGFDWHLTNLKNFVNLQKEGQSEQEYESADGKKFVVKTFGEGSGLLGVPGDFTPPSRFIRTAAMAKFSGSAESATNAVVQAWHIVNSVDITKGSAGEDQTQWAVVKDITNNIFYYRGYNHLSIRKIDLNKISKEKRTYVKFDDKFNTCVTDTTSTLKPYKDPKKEL